VLGDEGLQLDDELVMATQRKVGVQAILEHGQPQLGQPGDLTLGE
jgi:hypothetical protein